MSWSWDQTGLRSLFPVGSICILRKGGMFRQNSDQGEEFFFKVETQHQVLRVQAASTTSLGTDLGNCVSG